MAAGVAQSFSCPNFSGMLFAKGNEATPFSSMIGANPAITDHVEFVVGQNYDVEAGEQPEISETASLTAPAASFVARKQDTNVTQIFHYAIAVSYAHEANMGTLQGLNAAGQVANPNAELAFQINRKLAKAASDVEYSFVNGTYAKATSDATVNKTRGVVEAIKTNTIDATGKTFDLWLVAEAMKLIDDQGGALNNLVLGLSPADLITLAKACAANDLTIVPAARDVNGIAVDTVVTPLGTVGVKQIRTLSAGTGIIFDPAKMRPVYQPNPERGVFFVEPLSKTGAADQYQLFGEVGLDYGPEFYAAKIENIGKTA